MQTISIPAANSNRRQRSKRRSRDRQRTAHAGAGHHDQYGFLNQTFSPAVAEDFEYLEEKTSVERDFFTALAHFTTCYHFQLPDCKDLPYPYNIYLAYKYASQQLTDTAPEKKLLIIEPDDGHVTLATCETFYTDFDLYYIPVRPIINLLAAKQTSALGKLALSACAYLHHQCNVDYYTQKGSYLSDVHYSISEWLPSNEGEYSAQEFSEHLTECIEAKRMGKRFFNRLKNKRHFEQWEQRLHKFSAHTENETRLVQSITALYELYRDFPTRNAFDNCNPDFFDEGYYEQLMTLDFYLSFTWNNDGWLTTQEMEYVNADFQSADKDHPTVYQLFKKPQAKPDDSLAFEKRFFPLLNDFAYALKFF